MIEIDPAEKRRTGVEIVLEDSEQTPEQKEISGGYELFYPRLRKGESTFDVSVRLSVVWTGAAFRVDAEIDNRTDRWVATDMTGPVLNRFEMDFAKYPLLWPDGLGFRIAESPEANRYQWRRVGDVWRLNGSYPAVAFTLQQIVFAGEQNGVALLAPDADREAKSFSVDYNPATETGKASICWFCCVQPGSRWAKTVEEILYYRGDWRSAADYYRERFSPRGEALADAPRWVRPLAGMFLVIMNQQNDRHTMWTYDQIGGKMTDDAFAQGFDSIALFGWHDGGHDARFPEMVADDLLGGRQALIDGIAEAKKRGQRVFLYANGQLIDRGLTEYWAQEGEQLCVVGKNGETPEENWTIYEDAPGRQFGRACLLSKKWREKMLELALDAIALGSDGVLFDQVAVNGPISCYSTEHGHAVPAMTHGTAGAELLKEIRDATRRIDPDFIVLTEGFNDAALEGCDFYHSIGTGLYGTPSLAEIRAWRDGATQNGAFRSLFRYVWPETILTIRNPLPLQHRRLTNTACLLGLRNEVEIRFPADVESLASGVLPDEARYRQDALSQSRVSTLRLNEFKTPGLDTRQFVEYAKKVADFRRQNKEFLLEGLFQDERGFVCDGPVLASAFAADERLGVLVWNPEPEPVSFSLDVPDATLLNAVSPEFGDEPEPFAPLPPDSIRLIIWRTNSK